MRILVVGSGGREHALVWKLAQFHESVVAAPGNAGMAEIAECADVDPLDKAGILAIARRRRIDLVVVGPEAPLVAGLVDELKKEGVPVFGPDARGARLEGDKGFAKSLMQEQGIPTAGYELFDDYAQARAGLAERELPAVIKASGLAAGKGAVVVRERDEALRILAEMMVEARLGPAGRRVVVEDFLPGEEASVIGLCDGNRFEMLLPSQDHKQLLDRDQGPNTGGMGAYAPAPVVDKEQAARIEQEVFVPLLRGFSKAGIDYRGVVYAGMMLTEEGPKVLEFNCRFGDPETQAVLPLLENDLADLLLACAQGRLGEKRAVWSSRWALCVVAASEGYPGAYKKGLPIAGELGGTEDVVVFHAATRREDDRLVTNGGRVLGVTGIGADLSQAQRRAYEALGRIHFDGIQYRRDIGERGLARLGVADHR